MRRLEHHVNTYYAASANPCPEFRRLEGSERCDVAVIGAGFTGLSAALNLAERGYSVVLLEANRVGWGASGRNGGQVGSGQRKDVEELEKQLGVGVARQLWDLAEDAKQVVKERIARHQIACDFTPGQLTAASKFGDAEALKAHVEHMVGRYDYTHARFVPLNEFADMLGTRIYHGGMLDESCGHLHPLNYALGLAEAAQSAGARIFENSPVQVYTRGAPAELTLPTGTVQADYVVLACNAHLEQLEPRIAGKIMPINNFILATEPLGRDRARALIRDNVCVHDTLFVINYFRLSADHRLLFGGGETYRRRFPSDLKSFVRKYMLRVYPQLADTRIDYAWGGSLAITLNRLPHFGRLEPNVFFAQGYSGHGIALASLAGELMAEAIAGTAERFDVMAQLKIPTFPGGTLLRWPGLVMGMLYYALRDKLP